MRLPGDRGEEGPQEDHGHRSGEVPPPPERDAGEQRRDHDPREDAGPGAPGLGVEGEQERAEARVAVD